MERSGLSGIKASLINKLSKKGDTTQKVEDIACKTLLSITPDSEQFQKLSSENAHKLSKIQAHLISKEDTSFPNLPSFLPPPLETRENQSPQFDC